MSYDDSKTSPPSYYDDPDPVLYCARCRYHGDPEEFEQQVCEIHEDGEREEYTESACPMCGSALLEDAGQRDERLRDQYWQQKLDERLGK